MSGQIPETMRAVVLTGKTRAEDVRLSEVPVPAFRSLRALGFGSRWPIGGCPVCRCASRRRTSGARWLTA